MWKDTVRKTIVLPPRRSWALLWGAGGVLVLLLPAGLLALGDLSNPVTRLARLLFVVLASLFIFFSGWAILARLLQRR
jgi:hypothetical protein